MNFFTKNWLAVASLFICAIAAKAQAPVISSFAPLSGAVGTLVTITGTGFSSTAANNIVYFGAVKATVSAAAATSLTVSVPSGATYQPLSITAGGLTGYSAKPFIVTFAGGGSGFNAGSFFRVLDSSVGNNYNNNVSVGDFDGDGKPDILVESGSNTVSIYRNLSTVAGFSFAPKVNFIVGSTPNKVVAGDFNGDGKLDIAVTNGLSNTISVLKNTSTVGTISFATAIDFTTGIDPQEISVGDFNNDGKLDFVITYYNSNKISLFKNSNISGNISFETKVDIDVPLYTLMVSVGDLDGDGKPDIVTNKFYDTTVSILKNTSTTSAISFAPSINFTTDYGTQSVSIGDLDGDGKPDLAVACSSNHQFSALRNTTVSGILSFATHIDFGTTDTQKGFIADMNGDGKIDVLTVNYFTISLFQNTSTVGNISFAAKQEYPLKGFFGSDLFACDLDGDGKGDLTVSNTDFSVNYISIYKNLIGTNLPLQLLYFSAFQQNNTIPLSWQTANETNTSHFNIQRSANGVEFATLALVKAAGKGNGSYTYNDDLSNISILPSVFYYRLQMMDNNGSFTYSKTVSVALHPALYPLQLFPNPVKETLTAQVTASKVQNATVQVTDINGKVLQQQLTKLIKGVNMVKLNTVLLAKGSYILTVKGDGWNEDKQFVKE